MDGSLSVITFNIRNGRACDGGNSWPFRRRWVPAYIRDLDADVVGLQEAFHNQVVAVEKALHGYERVGVGRDNGRRKGEYCPIFVRSERLTILDHGAFWFSDTPDAPGSCTWGNTLPRICTWALLSDARPDGSGGLIRMCNLHLDHADADARLRSAELLLVRLKEWRAISPVVIMGDFNAGERSPVLARLLGAEAGLLDTFRVRRPRARLVGTFHAWAGTAGGAKIDHILATPDIEVLDAAILRDTVQGRLPSDHWPVMARLRATNPTADGSTL